MILEAIVTNIYASLAGSGPWRERPWRQKLTTLDMFVRMKMDSAS